MADNAVQFIESQLIATGLSPRDKNWVKERSELSFHLSRRSVRRLGSATGQDFLRFFITGFLETDTEAYAVVAVAVSALAERRSDPTLSQEPPRRTRDEPDAGPAINHRLPVG